MVSAAEAASAEPGDSGLLLDCSRVGCCECANCVGRSEMLDNERAGAHVENAQGSRAVPRAVDAGGVGGAARGLNCTVACVAGLYVFIYTSVVFFAVRPSFIYDEASTLPRLCVCTQRALTTAAVHVGSVFGVGRRLYRGWSPACMASSTSPCSQA